MAFASLPMEIFVMVFDSLNRRRTGAGIFPVETIGNACLVSSQWRARLQYAYVWQLYHSAYMGQSEVMRVFDKFKNFPSIYKETRELLNLPYSWYPVVFAQFAPDDVCSEHMKTLFLKKFTPLHDCKKRADITHNWFEILIIAGNVTGLRYWMKKYPTASCWFNPGFYLACQFGHQTMVQMFWDDFPIHMKSEEILNLFTQMCEDNNIQIVQWLSEHFEFEIWKDGQLGYGLLRTACLLSHLELAKCLQKIYKFEVDRLPVTYTTLSITMYKCRDKDVVEWIQTEFKLMPRSGKDWSQAPISSYGSIFVKDQTHMSYVIH